MDTAHVIEMHLPSTVHTMPCHTIAALVTTFGNAIKMHANVIYKRHLKIEPKTLQCRMLMTHTQCVYYTHTHKRTSIIGIVTFISYRIYEKTDKFTDKSYGIAHIGNQINQPS